MLVMNLIKELEKLPKNSTIGMINIGDVRLIPKVYIRTNDEIVCDITGVDISIEEIEKSRISNKEKVCDYYIV